MKRRFKLLPIVFILVYSINVVVFNYNADLRNSASNVKLLGTINNSNILTVGNGTITIGNGAITIGNGTSTGSATTNSTGSGDTTSTSNSTDSGSTTSTTPGTGSGSTTSTTPSTSSGSTSETPTSTGSGSTVGTSTSASQSSSSASTSTSSTSTNSKSTSAKSSSNTTSTSKNSTKNSTQNVSNNSTSANSTQSNVSNTVSNTVTETPKAAESLVVKASLDKGDINLNDKSTFVKLSCDSDNFKQLYYNWSSNKEVKHEETWTKYSEQLNFDKTGVWYLHYKAVDKSGNDTYGYFGPYNESHIYSALSSSGASGFEKKKIVGYILIFAVIAGAVVYLLKVNKFNLRKKIN